MAAPMAYRMTDAPSPLPRRWAMEVLSVAALVAVWGLPVLAVARARAGAAFRSRRVLVVGAPAAVELTGPELRAAITEALLRDRDALGRALGDRAARLLARVALAAQREGIAGAPWRAYATLA